MLPPHALLGRQKNAPFCPSNCGFYDNRNYTFCCRKVFCLCLDLCPAMLSITANQPIFKANTMQLTLHIDNDYAVRGIDAGLLIILGQTRLAPYSVSAHGLSFDLLELGVGSVAELKPVHVASLLTQSPEVVLLATGMRLQFPSPEVRAAFASHGLGLEVMDTRAAAYTYNVLLQEQRDVLLIVLG